MSRARSEASWRKGRLRYFIVRGTGGLWQPYRTRMAQHLSGQGAEFGTWEEAQKAAVRWSEMEERIGRLAVPG